jgi:small-conductance mechanosensitive channel
MSFNSLDTLLTTVWYSLDDIFVCVGVFLAARVLATAIRSSLRDYFKCGHYISEISHFAILFVVIIFLVGHLIGTGTANSLFGGFSIGFGYAMQPYIVSLLAGATFRSGAMFKTKDVIQINGFDYVVDHVGLLYVCATRDGYKTYFPNSLMVQSPVGVKSN